MTPRSPTAVGPARGAAPAAAPSAAVLWAAGLVAVALGLAALPHAFDGRVLDMVVDVILLVFSSVAGLSCLRAARRDRGTPRRGWTALTIACWGWAASQALWTLLVTGLGIDLPYPSPVELGYLLFPVAATIGLRRSTTPEAGQSGSRRVLDRLMIGSALGLVAWVTVLDSVVDSSAASVLLAVVALYYPLTDVVLLTAVVIAVAQLRHDVLRWALLGGGMVLMAVTDHVFAYQLALGSYRGGTAFDWGWWVAFALIGAAAAVPGSRAPSGQDRPTGLRVLNQLAPYAPLATALAVVAANLVIAIEDDTVAEFLLLGLMVLVLLRQYVMLRDNLALEREVKDREALLRHRAMHDELTGLPNRALFLDRLEHALALAGRDRRPVSVAFLDLDGFKAVNDTLGHAAGDALLVRVADRLRGSVRAADSLARLGGDEFAVVIEHGEPTAAAEGMVAALEAPFRFEERTVAVSASVGVATVEPGRAGAAVAAGLLHRADVAMYAVKVSGKGHVQVHSPALDLARRPGGPGLLQAFAKALTTGGVRADYQPVVDPVSGRIGALEALARWTLDGVDVPPSTFIPICAGAGLFDRLTATMLEQSCEMLERWNRDLGHRRLRVAVNVDPTDFSDPGLVDRVAALVSRHRLGPGQLALEMTEIAGDNRPDTAMEVMRRLRALGVRIALDDFGTGYSTLSRLSTTTVDTVKIDRSFVADIDHDDKQRSFMAALLELARHLGLRTIAEGVERRGQLRVLRELGCDLVQGHFIARPASAADTTLLVLADRPLLPPDLLDPVTEQAGTST